MFLTKIRRGSGVKWKESPTAKSLFYLNYYILLGLEKVYQEITGLIKKSEPHIILELVVLYNPGTGGPPAPTDVLSELDFLFNYIYLNTILGPTLFIPRVSSSSVDD